MDPVTMIVAALTAGAVAGAQGTATEAVKDLYAGLKALLTRRLEGKPSAEVALREHESDPDSWEPALQAQLVKADVATDPVVLEAAHRLLELHDPAGTQAGKYQIDLRGAQGVQAGDFNTQHNTFGNSAAQS